MGKAKHTNMYEKIRIWNRDGEGEGERKRER